MQKKLETLLENQEYKKLKEELLKLNEQDIAIILQEASVEEIFKIYRLLPKDIASDVFVNLPIETEQDLITKMTSEEAGSLIEDLASDDAVDILDEMPAMIVSKILANTTKETRKEINELLNYPEDSAGSIMTTEYLDFKIGDTIDLAIKKIKKEGKDKETINNCFVLSSTRKLIGSVEIKDILLASDNTKIEDIMDTNIIYCETLDDQEKVALNFKKYDLLAMPVVDSEKKMVGIITVDDIVDIIEEEASEDIDKMAAITPIDKPYLSRSVFAIFKSRIPWLLLLMISATFTSMIIQKYEAALASVVILTSFIPMFMDTAGNAGSQASVTIIRGLATNEIKFKDTLKVLFKEIRISILCGITLSLCNFAKLMLFDKVSVSIALVVCVTLLVTIIFAKIIGSMLPLLAKKLGFDPAVMASPFITTIVDALSLMVYFNVASLILGI